MSELAWRRSLGARCAGLVAVLVMLAGCGGGSSKSSQHGSATAQHHTNPPAGSGSEKPVTGGAVGASVALNAPDAKLPIQPPATYYQDVPQANCGQGSKPETGFQGEVPLKLRDAGFTGFSCNLERLGQYQGQGASWQHTWYSHCAYYDQALPAKPGSKSNGVSVGTWVGHRLKKPGTVVLDVSDPAHPKRTATLDTPGMVHPWEDLKVNEPRGLLAGQLQAGAPLDVYSVKGDCAHPKLLASTPLKDFGHEGEWEPDGRTYWASYTRNSEYHAIDMTDPRHPKEILDWKLPQTKTHQSHGLSFSPDGNTAYFSVIGNSINDPAASAKVADNGFIIADVSSIQNRSPNPHVRILSEITFLDGGIAQHTIPVTIAGKPYLVFVDELGAIGLGSPADWRLALKDGFPPFGIARIFDISNPKEPKLVSRLTLQSDSPANAKTAVNDVIKGGQTVFSYDSHYCSVDTPSNATALACGYFNAGVRVFDIRDPAHPKEIAYYNPPAQQSKMKELAGSEHAQTETAAKLTKNGLSADWCSSQSRFYEANGQHYLWITCQDNGFQVLKFTNNAYPLH